MVERFFKHCCWNPVELPKQPITQKGNLLLQTIGIKPYFSNDIIRWQFPIYIYNVYIRSSPPGGLNFLPEKALLSHKMAKNIDRYN